MNFRLFSTKYNLYTNSLFWPSNQRTTSEFVLRPDGKILEIINFDNGYDEIKEHDSRNYIVEPWTGYFDSKGKKIYRGDLLIAENDPEYLAEVVWDEGCFNCKSTRDPGNIMALHLDVKVWKRVLVYGNIHNVEYTD